MTDRDQMQHRRAQLRREYRELYDQVAAIFFEEDPAGINFEFNTDEYEPEVGTILPRLQHCHDVADAQAVVHEEFLRWFDTHTTGRYDRYATIAERIWAAWKSFKQS